MKKAIRNKVPSHLLTSHFMLNELLSDFTSQNMVEKYFAQIIRPGDYYTLKNATEIIEDQNFIPQKELDMIYILKEINRQGIAKTGASLVPNARFYRALKALAKLKINPVTIPKSYGVKHIPNLLDAFNKLKDSGTMPHLTHDPFEPFETFTNNTTDCFNDLHEGSDPAQDTEPEYEHTFVFGWELPRN